VQPPDNKLVPDLGVHSRNSHQSTGSICCTLHGQGNCEMLAKLENGERKMEWGMRMYL